ncbi:hypothetical protein BaRGS_00002548 [Batillaria attramentaria]|uniref:Cadherin domain-containing protein n=1 Tax=Batillaria attramentaria TaxID=370345 RepID=A0ABD0M4H7_9CAEN
MAVVSLLGSPMAHEIAPVFQKLYVVASDNGVVRRTSAIRVRITVVRNRNGPVFSAAAYNVTIDETVSSGQSILRVTASDADGDRITYTMLNTVPASLYFSVDSGTGVIRIRNSLILDSTTTYTMTIEAVDSPVQGASPRFALAEVFVNVCRNPNAPVFAADFYNITVSEYIPVRSTVQRVVATDADAPNTPSGKLVYTIVGVSYPNPAFNIAPAENDFFIASPTSGDIILGQQLSQARVPDVFTLTVEVADSAIPPKTAQTKVQVNIVRNIHRPTFTEIRYGAAIADTWAVGRTLFTVTAVDDDDSTPFNIDTPNAYFDYMIDEHYNPLADTYFGVTIDGVVYVRNNLLLDNSNSYFFYIIAIDRSWNPLSSRAPVIINVTKSDIVRTVGFTNRIYFWEIVETVATTTRADVYSLEVANVDAGQSIICSIEAINGQTTFNRNLFAITRTVDNNCEVTRTGLVDREIVSSYNLTVVVRYNNLIINKRSVDSHRAKRQIENAFTYPVYPPTTGSVYVFAISQASEPGSLVGTVVASDPDAGVNGSVSLALASSTGNSAFFVLRDDGNLYTRIKFNIQPNISPSYALIATATDGFAGQPKKHHFTSLCKHSHDVNLIENKHRFLLVLGGTKPRDIVPQKEAVRRYLQTAIGQIVLIESIQTRLVVNNGILDYDEDGVTSSSIRENVNTNVGNVVQIRKPYDLTAVTGLSQRLSDSSLMSELSQFAFQLSKPITKSHVWWTDEPWAAFVALGGIVIILALVGVIVILRSYNKYNNYWERYRIYHATMASADFTEPPSFLREYETQSLNMYVPPDETVQELGEINMAYASGAAGTGNGTSTSIQNPVYGKQPNPRPTGHQEGTTVL